MATNVLCEVNSCRYWAEQNRCSAASIKIANHGVKEADRPAETDCVTFEVK